MQIPSVRARVQPQGTELQKPHSQPLCYALQRTLTLNSGQRSSSGAREKGTLESQAGTGKEEFSPPIMEVAPAAAVMCSPDREPQLRQGQGEQEVLLLFLVTAS